jgi:hypothetical protein
MAERSGVSIWSSSPIAFTRLEPNVSPVSTQGFAMTKCTPLERKRTKTLFPPAALPKAVPPGALPYPLLRRLSSTSHSRAAPRSAGLQAAPAG